MVHADDPLSPAKVFDRLADVGELPVEHGADPAAVDEHVLGTELAVHDDDTVTGQPGEPGRVDLLELDPSGRRGAGLLRMSGLDHVLAVRSGQFLHDQRRQ